MSNLEKQFIVDLITYLTNILTVFHSSVHIIVVERLKMSLGCENVNLKGGCWFEVVSFRLFVVNK